MTIALIMVTKNIYLKNGILHLLRQKNNNKYKYFEFCGRASVYEIIQQHSYTYIICDNNNYFFYDFLFSGNTVKCICVDNISTHDENCLSIDYMHLPEQIFRSLNETEREILYLYFIKRRKIKEISRITGLSVSKIYYRTRMIKIKFGAKTTRKLPALFKSYL
ncbi:TPA: hypothetical protein IBK74_004466 [Escherichia coli]|nr:hypothetical protein [Escherichia coli]